MRHVTNLMLTIRNRSLRHKVLKLVVEVIETSFIFLKPEVVVQLVVVLSRILNKNINGTQMRSEDENQIDLYCKMIEKILYRFFFNQNDNSLKFNDF